MRKKNLMRKRLLPVIEPITDEQKQKMKQEFDDLLREIKRKQEEVKG